MKDFGLRDHISYVLRPQASGVNNNKVFGPSEPEAQVLLGVGRGDFALRLLRDWTSAHGLYPACVWVSPKRSAARGFVAYNQPS